MLDILLMKTIIEIKIFIMRSDTTLTCYVVYENSMVTASKIIKEKKNMDDKLNEGVIT